MKKAFRVWLLLSVPLLLAILSADLLYLYIYHWWYDPTKGIEYVEVALMVSFIPLGLWAFWQTLKGLMK